MKIPNTTRQIFNDEFYELIEESIDTEIYNDIKYKFGDILIYNLEKQNIDIISGERLNKELDKKIIGIVIKQNDDLTIDLMMKNFLTSDGIHIPIEYIAKPSNMYAYIYQIFNRYCNKFKRISDINIDIFNYNIPSIAQMDYIYKNFDILTNIFQKIWDEDRYNNFINRFYKHGIICLHKNKYYQWLPKETEKRKINNIDIYHSYEFLPVFSLQYEFS